MAIEFVATYEDMTGLGQAIAALGGIELDFQPLVPELEAILQAENRTARLEGEDVHGGYLLDVKDRSARRGPGPPLAPHYEESRVITNHVVRVETGPNYLRMWAGWEGVPWLLYHAQGAGRLPIRDILGSTPEADQFLSDVLNEFCRLRVEDALMLKLDALK